MRVINKESNWRNVYIGNDPHDVFDIFGRGVTKEYGRGFYADVCSDESHDFSEYRVSILLRMWTFHKSLSFGMEAYYPENTKRWENILRFENIGTLETAARPFLGLTGDSKIDSENNTFKLKILWEYFRDLCVHGLDCGIKCVRKDK